MADLSRAKVALVTDGGFVPKGNPDGIEPLAATRYGAYDVSGKDQLPSTEYENVHRGYDTTYVEEDPNRLIPLDVVRELEHEGKIGSVHDLVYSTTGVATTLDNSRRMGREIAAKGAAQQGPQAFAAFHMRLFQAHFGDQADISQPETLFRLARDAGLDVDRLAHACAGEPLRRAVLEDWAEAIAWFGVSSLPTVILDEKLALVGVRTLEEYAHVIEHLSWSL